MGPGVRGAVSLGGGDRACTAPRLLGRGGELHATGLAEVDRIDAEMTELGGRALGTATLVDPLAALRGDPALHFATGKEILDVAARSLARANEAIPGWFGRLPRTPCEVVPMPAHEERHSTIAYYREPAADRVRPGRDLGVDTAVAAACELWNRAEPRLRRAA